jgi:hypothetical protein
MASKKRPAKAPARGKRAEAKPPSAKKTFPQRKQFFLMGGIVNEGKVQPKTKGD